MKTGCVPVNTNPLSTATEMVHQFTDSGATVLVVSDMFADRLGEVVPKTAMKAVVTVRIAEFFPPVIAGVIRMVQKWWSRTLPVITVEHTALPNALAAGRERRDSAALEGYLDGVGSDTLAALQYTDRKRHLARSVLCEVSCSVREVDAGLARGNGARWRGDAQRARSRRVAPRTAPHRASRRRRQRR